MSFFGKYNVVSQDELEPGQHESKSSSYLVHSHRLYGVFIVYSAALLLVGAWLGQVWSTGSGRQECGRIYDSQSPLFDKVRPSTTRTRFNGSFWPGDHPAIFRQPPSDAVDAAWEHISNGRDIILSGAEVVALGKDPRQTVRADPSWGFGSDAHLGLIHAMHQNHCLNNLRKSVYYNHYYRHRRGFGANPPDDYRAKYYAHLDHCIDFLRQDIACKADMSVSTYRWMHGEKVPEADFNTWHQCRDFGRLREWHAKHEINAGLTLEQEKERWTTFGPGPDDVMVAQEADMDASFWDVNTYDE